MFGCYLAVSEEESPLELTHYNKTFKLTELGSNVASGKATPVQTPFPKSFWQGKSIVMFCNLPNLAYILYCHTYNTEDETEVKEFKEPPKEAEKEKIELAGMFNDSTTWYPLETSQQYTMLGFHNDT